MSPQTFKDASERTRIELLAKLHSRQAITPVEICKYCGYGRCICRCPGCEECQGTGYVTKYLEGFSTKIEPCKNYSRITMKAAAQAGHKMGGLEPDELLKLDWSMVKPGFSDGIKARDAVANAYKRGHGIVLLFGNFGQAKTLTMKIAVAQALRDGKRAHYAKLTQVLDDIRLAYDQESYQNTALLERFRAWSELDVLALDEMDKASQTSWAIDRMFQLIDDRYTLAIREKSLTITAGNWQSLNDLNSSMGYFRSRIEDNRFASVGNIVYLNGADGRKAMPTGYRF